MQFRSKIIAFALLLSSGAVLCALTTLILARGIDRGMQSVNLAEDQLALYLAMETNVSDMLRLYVAAVAAPSEVTRRRLSATKTAVRGDVEAIRAIILAEAAVSGVAEGQELDRLDAIVEILEEIETVFDAVNSKELGAQPVEDLAAPLTFVLDALDEKLAPLVDLSIANEAAEVFQARAEIAALGQRSVTFGTAAAGLTLAAALIGVLVLLSAFMRPFGAILEGATRLANGHLSYRIPETGQDEFGRLSRDFNVMAAQLEQSDQALRAEEEDLQRRVAARTRELEEANTRLSAQDATRRRFLADVSHELRTPLTVMRGEAEVALRAGHAARRAGEAGLDAGAQDALEAVVAQSEDMSRLVDDLLFVARREAGEAPLHMSDTALGPLLERIVADARQLGNDADIVLVIDPMDHETHLHVDGGRIRQLLLVLLDNALRYSPTGAQIRVTAQTTPQHVEIRVIDQGIGIPSADLPHIFDRFVRGSNALPGGTGLGLPVAQAIATAHGGTLSIDSREGDSTAVTLSLPIAPPVSETVQPGKDA